MSDRLNAALDLAARGFSVFPLTPGGKTPAIGLFFSAATTDPETIKRWWTERDYNVGVSTTGLVVVDIDTKRGEDGVGAYALLGGDYRTFVVQTPSGGYHCYFTGPDSSLEVGLVPGIDIRAWHGYTVGPGSVVRNGEYRIAVDQPMAYVPVGIECLLRPPRQPRTHLSSFDLELDLPTSLANAQVWLQNEPAAIEGQGGDLKTYQVAAKLLRDFALSEEAALYLMSENWNPRCSPPWSIDELYKKVENAQNYATGELGTALPSETFKSVQLVEPTPPYSVEPESFGLRLGNAMNADAIHVRPFVALRLLMRGEVTMLVAAGGGGKSTFTLTALAHFALGRDFGPYKLTAPGVPLRSMIYNAEEKLEEQTRRLLALCSVYGFDYEEVRKNLLLVTREHVKRAGGGPTGLVVAQAVMGQVTIDAACTQFIKDLIKMNEIHIAVLEPLVNLHTVNENDNTQMKKVMAIFEDIAEECDIPVWLTHHTSKGGDQADRAGRAGAGRGAGSVEGSARINLTLTGATKEDKQRYGIRDHEARNYVRIDSAKANYFQVGDENSVWFKWHNVTIHTTDKVGVLYPVSIEGGQTDMRQRMATILRDAIINAEAGHIILSHAITALQANEPLFEVMNNQTLRDKVKKVFYHPVKIDGSEDRILCESTGTNVLVRIV